MKQFKGGGKVAMRGPAWSPTLPPVEISAYDSAEEVVAKAKRYERVAKAIVRTMESYTPLMDELDFRETLTKKDAYSLLDALIDVRNTIRALTPVGGWGRT